MPNVSAAVPVMKNDVSGREYPMGAVRITDLIGRFSLFRSRAMALAENRTFWAKTPECFWRKPMK
jgi:hypothetical protein